MKNLNFSKKLFSTISQRTKMFLDSQAKVSNNGKIIRLIHENKTENKLNFNIFQHFYLESTEKDEKISSSTKKGESKIKIFPLSSPDEKGNYIDFYINSDHETTPKEFQVFILIN